MTVVQLLSHRARDKVKWVLGRDFDSYYRYDRKLRWSTGYVEVSEAELEQVRSIKGVRVTKLSVEKDRLLRCWKMKED